MMQLEQRLKEYELREKMLMTQINRMHKELEAKDEEIRILRMQLKERDFVLDSVLARITLKE